MLMLDYARATTGQIEKITALAIVCSLPAHHDGSASLKLRKWEVLTLRC